MMDAELLDPMVQQANGLIWDADMDAETAIHSERVAQTVQERHLDPVMTAAALLHDWHEETDNKLSVLVVLKFPWTVIQLVIDLTHAANYETYKEYIARLHGQARDIKLADLHDNLTREGSQEHNCRSRYLQAWMDLTGVEYPLLDTEIPSEKYE